MSEKPVESLSESEAADELKRLAKEMAEHDRRYHTEDAPTISDAEYDALARRNLAIEERFPGLVREDSPSRRVGSPPAEGFAKVRHAVPMLSLAKAYTDEDVTDPRSHRTHDGTGRVTERRGRVGDRAQCRRPREQQEQELGHRASVRRCRRRAATAPLARTSPPI